MAAPNTRAAFVWGPNGEALTYDELERQRALEARRAAGGIDTSPVGSWTQGLARVADALAGSVRRGQLDSAAADNRAWEGRLFGDVLGGGAQPQAEAAPAAQPQGAAPAGDMGAYQRAISSIESGGDYGAVGPTHDRLGRALGKYQVMEANVGPWSQEALGRAVTPDEFLANPELQDQVFNHRFGQYVAQFGPEKAAQAWFAGPGGIGTNRQDSLGTSVSQYANKFSAALGSAPAPGQPQAAAPTAPPPPVRVASADNSDPNPVLMALAQRGGAVQASPGVQGITAALQGGAGGGAQSAGPMGAGAPTPAPAASPAAPQQVAQAPLTPGRQTVTGALMGVDPRLLQGMASGRLSPQGQAIAQMLVQQQMQQYQQANDPMRRMQAEKTQIELNNLRNPPEPDAVRGLRARADAAGLTPGTPEYNQLMISGGRGPLVQVNTGENNSKFVEKSDEAAAKRLNEIVEGGNSAGQMLSDVQQLAELGTQIGTGKGAQVMAVIGPYAQALGVDVKGLDESQAYNAIIARVAPQMRPAGSGASSDFDARQFLSSLPSIGNTPEGNRIITDTFQAMQQNKIAAADIASKAYLPKDQGGLTWQEAEKQIRALPNPYQAFKAFREGKSGTLAPSPAAQPAPAADGWTTLPNGVRIREKAQ
ncbi:hypothetical protein FHS55_002630 [Angulomicrobium tetraedrale]|uniref:Phage tail lysozyme domain-containing protein n=1 Tax=Ancylobacter tetraedralis TaxID=217068 RepID=A0A839ZBC8_9HYPH|nr:hypothetical protein [Ancylobacter tetraedralis]MBB3772021.1 hypothetical protein [Ancylobacter tetraedralis]